MTLSTVPRAVVCIVCNVIHPRITLEWFFDHIHADGGAPKRLQQHCPHASLSSRVLRSCHHVRGSHNIIAMSHHAASAPAMRRASALPPAVPESNGGKPSCPSFPPSAVEQCPRRIRWEEGSGSSSSAARHSRWVGGRDCHSCGLVHVVGREHTAVLSTST